MTANTKISALPTITNVGANSWVELSDNGVSSKANTTQFQVFMALSAGFGTVNTSSQVDLTANSTSRVLHLVPAGGVAITQNANTQTVTIDTTTVFALANSNQTAVVAAFAQANTAQATGVAAFAQANTANTTSVAAFAKANSAATDAATAGTQANTARDQANNAYVQGNTAATIGSAAFATANLALPKTGGTVSGSVLFQSNVSVVGNTILGSLTSIGAVVERANIAAYPVTGNINVNVLLSTVEYWTNSATGNATINFKGNTNVTLDNTISTGQSLTCAFLVTNGAAAKYLSAFQVDGVGVTPKWSGGTAVSSGNANSVDSYAITLIKTAGATYTAIIARTQYA